MPSVRVLRNDVQTDVAGFMRCWNDSAPLISSRLGTDVPLIVAGTDEERSRLQAMVQSRNFRTYGYDTSDTDGLAVAGILQLFHPSDLRPERDEPFVVKVTMAAIRKRAGEGLAVLRPRLRRTLFHCLTRMANDAIALPFPVFIVAEYADVDDADDGGPVTLRAFLREMAARNGKAGAIRNGFVRWSDLTPQDILTGLAGIVA